MTDASSVVTLAREGDIAVITIDAPPVNALSLAVREGLVAALKAAAASDARAVLLLCAGRTFIAGADIAEFGKDLPGPTFRDVQDAMDAVPMPLIAAIHGTALGGGLEVALCAHVRVAAPGTKLGLPEVTLGLVPGAGGTQRLPRLIGVEKALAMIVEGKPVGAEEALAIGLIDAILPGADLKAEALAFARDAAGWGVRRIRDMEVPPAAPEIFAAAWSRDFRRLEAPAAAIRCVEAATRLSFADGLAFERETFETCKASPQSTALRHAFFAARRAAKIPDVPDDMPRLPISTVGIVGAGLMGGGIAMCFANADFPVILVEAGQEALDRGLAAIHGNYETAIKRGRLSTEEGGKRLTRITPSLAMESLADCDLVVEAVFERMDVKKDIFARLDAIAKPGAILASNTSRLDLDAIAAVTSRPGHVLGLHFFSPVHVMKLLEVVRGAKTEKPVIATAMALARTIGKVAVLVGMGPGFVGNRMLAQRTREAQAMVLEGATPWDVDRVLTDFGFPMGPFRMADMVGLDLYWNKADSKGQTLVERLCEMDRRGLLRLRCGWKASALARHRKHHRGADGRETHPAAHPAGCGNPGAQPVFHGQRGGAHPGGRQGHPRF